jgi:hypothetical protein
MNKTLTDVMPSATPSESELAAWNELSREEQLRRMRQTLAQSDCTTVCNDSMTDILALAKQRTAAQKHG